MFQFLSTCRLRVWLLVSRKLTDCSFFDVLFTFTFPATVHPSAVLIAYNPHSSESGTLTSRTMCALLTSYLIFIETRLNSTSGMFISARCSYRWLSISFGRTLSFISSSWTNRSLTSSIGSVPLASAA